MYNPQYWSMASVMAAPRTTGKRQGLGKEIDDLLADFCAAHFGAPATEIVRAAVRKFIRDSLENEPELNKRFEEARKIRLGSVPPKIVRLNSND